MEEIPERLNYAEWDSEDHVVPDDFLLTDKSFLHEALRVFYAAGGYDFFKVVRPEKYADNWIGFVGRLYADIESGRFAPDGKHHALSVSDEERRSLREQGVPSVFTEDIQP